MDRFDRQPSPAAAPAVLAGAHHARIDDSGELFELDVLVVGHDAAAVQAANAAAQAGARVLLIGHPAKHHHPPAHDSGLVQGVVHLPAAIALELLCDTEGRVRGAAGKLNDDSPWWALAHAVVLGSADCLLMAVEAGAQLADIDRPGGGIHRANERGATGVGGLWAVGAAAAASELPRLSHAERLLHARQAGAAAAAGAASQAGLAEDPSGPLRPAGLAGLRGPGQHPISPQATQSALHAVLASAAEPGSALRRLDALWHFLRGAAPAPRGARRATREAAQAVAVARWRLLSVQARASGTGTVLSGGLDHAWARPGQPPVDSPDNVAGIAIARSHPPLAAPRAHHPVHTIEWASAWAR